MKNLNREVTKGRDERELIKYFLFKRMDPDNIVFFISVLRK